MWCINIYCVSFFTPGYSKIRYWKIQISKYYIIIIDLNQKYNIVYSVGNEQTIRLQKKIT